MAPIIKFFAQIFCKPPTLRYFKGSAFIQSCIPMNAILFCSHMTGFSLESTLAYIMPSQTNVAGQAWGVQIFHYCQHMKTLDH